MSLQTKDLVGALKRRPLLFCCGVVAVGFGLTLYFRFGLSETTHARLAEREKEFQRLSNNTKFSAQLDTQLQTLRNANATIAAGALRVGELARNQQLFFRLETETGVKLLDLRQLPIPAPAKGAPLTTYVSVPFSVTVKGSYDQLVDFLRRLDRAPTLSRVTGGSIAQPVDGSQSLNLSVELLGFRE